MHILVVEDEVALCDTIVRSLKRLAYSVDYCYDGQKALDNPFTCLNWERHFAPPLSKNFSTFFENKKSRLF